MRGRRIPERPERAFSEAGLGVAEVDIGGLCNRNGVPERQG